MTRAVVATAYGGAEVLEVVDVDLPAPGEGQVLVDVRAAAYNPADWKIYGGLWGADPAALPRRVGLEGTGVVAAVGPEVTGFEVGDAVVVHPAGGAFATQVLVRPEVLEHKPRDLAWEQAAGLLLAGGTAWHALDAVGLGAAGRGGAADDDAPGLGAGSPGARADDDAVHAARETTLLVHGGAGAVGSLAVQLAVGRGARVLATCGAANDAYVRSLGAEPVRYGPGLAERVRAAAPDGVTHVIDTVGTVEAIDVSVELLAERSRIATVAGLEHGARYGIRLLGHGPGMDPGDEVRHAARVPLLELAAARRLTVRIAARFTLDEVREAHELIASGHAPGKVLLVPSSSA